MEMDPFGIPESIEAFRRGANRRDFLRLTGLAGVAVAGSALLAACSPSGGGGSGSKSAGLSPTDKPDMDKARKEGLTIWHPDDPADVTTFLKSFTAATGIAATQTSILPGQSLPKLQQLFKAHQPSCDVYQTSDLGTMNTLQKQGVLDRYISPELSAYDAKYKSSPEGYWSTHYVNLGPMMYRTDHVSAADAPKSYLDLLDPQWKESVGFQNSSAGSQYAWWFTTKEVVPEDYFTKLAALKPRGYDSSTTMLSDINSGNLKIGGKVSIFQYTKAVRANQPVGLVLPEEGTNALQNVFGIVSDCKSPNAARVYADYLLSKEGQEAWTQAQGSYSARPDVTVKELPPLSGIKLLFPTDKLAEYQSDKTHAEFVSVWNKVLGVS